MHAVALHFMYYNFMKVHQTLKVTPAMEAGLTDRLWDRADLVAVVDANEEAPKKRGPYKQRISKCPTTSQSTLKFNYVVNVLIMRITEKVPGL